MTAYSLDIRTWMDKKHSSLWSTIEQCQAETERIAGENLEWKTFKEGYLPEADYSLVEGVYRKEVTYYARIHVTGENIVDHGFELSGVKSWSGIFENKEEATQRLRRSDGSESGLLSDWTFIPIADVWVALYFDHHLGPEIATLTRVEVQGLVRET